VVLNLNGGAVEGTKPEGVRGSRRRVGGRGRQDGGVIGAVSGPPLAVSGLVVVQFQKLDSR
jgi:hypothetical protein